MISFDIPVAPRHLHVRRVRRLSPFILAVLPLGWVMLVVAGDFHLPLGQLGLLVFLTGFFASLLIVPTGVQRISGGVAQGLDEMQLTARLKAQSEAFRWFSLWVLVMALTIELVPPLTGLPLSSAEPAMAIFFLWVIAWSITLPAHFLARSIPLDEEEEGEEVKA